MSFGKNLIYKGPRPGFCAKTKGLLHHIRDISAEKEKRCLLICGQRQQDCTELTYQSHPHIHGTVSTGTYRIKVVIKYKKDGTTYSNTYYQKLKASDELESEL